MALRGGSTTADATLSRARGYSSVGRAPFRERCERGHWFRASPAEVRQALGDRSMIDLYRPSEAKARAAARLAAEAAKTEAARALAAASAEERRRLRRERRHAAGPVQAGDPVCREEFAAAWARQRQHVLEVGRGGSDGADDRRIWGACRSEGAKPVDQDLGARSRGGPRTAGIAPSRQARVSLPAAWPSRGLQRGCTSELPASRTRHGEARARSEVCGIQSPGTTTSSRGPACLATAGRGRLRLASPRFQTTRARSTPRDAPYLSKARGLRCRWSTALLVVDVGARHVLDCLRTRADRRVGGCPFLDL